VVTAPSAPGPNRPQPRPISQIEVNTLITPRKPVGSSPDDDDQTGVRAMLSALPEPDPMPAYLVERISASLAAEQAQREDVPGSSVTPMLASTRRRPGRLLMAIAGAAAAVVLIGVVGNTMQATNQTTAAGDTASSALTSGSREAQGAVPPSAGEKTAPGRVLTPASIEIRSSDVRYTGADFVTQVRSLRGAALDSVQPKAVTTVEGQISTAGDLTGCLSAIGADGAQSVWADVAFYERQPAVIIVATTDGVSTAYVVGRECSRAHPALLRPATPLP
jgi:hypothetical protein